MALSFASAALAIDNGLGLTPPMGYSSWNDCASEVTEARIKQVTKHMISTGLAAKGYIHINVDEGWLKARNATTGELIEDREKFPSGMKALGDWIRDQDVPGKGKVMKYGLYTSRGDVQCSTQQYQGPGGHGYEKQDAAWLAAAGADYLKVDSCGGSQDHPTAFSDYGKWRDGLNATGRPVYLSLCGWYDWYAPTGASLGNSWRIAGDGTNWGALSNCANLNSKLQAYAKPGGWNDPDLLQGTGVGSNDKATNPNGCFDPKYIPQSKNWYQNESQSRAQFTLWAVMAAPLLISADVGQVSAHQLETWGNDEVIEVSQTFRAGGPYQAARLVGGDLNFGAVVGGGWTGSGHNVWGKLLPGSDFVLAFVSNEDAPTDVTCDDACFAQLAPVAAAADEAAPSAWKVRDLWAHEDVGTVEVGASGFSWTAKQLPIHGGIAAYRFSPATAADVVEMQMAR